MNAIAQTCRGAFASALWLGGMPYLNMRVARSAADVAQARRLIARHCRLFLDRCRVKVEVDGDPPMPGQGCVLSYNESSFMDVAAFAKVMWPYLEHAAAAELYGYIPFGRRAAAKSNIALVPRGNRAGTDRLLVDMVAAIKTGDRVAWGGEGRISGIDGIGHFKIGGSLLAIRAQVPIQPVAFYGGHAIMPLGSVRARPGTVYVRFGAPIPTKGLEEADARAFADQTRAVFVSMYADLKQKSARIGP